MTRETTASIRCATSSRPSRSGCFVPGSGPPRDAAGQRPGMDHHRRRRARPGSAQRQDAAGRHRRRGPHRVPAVRQGADSGRDSGSPTDGPTSATSRPPRRCSRITWPAGSRPPRWTRNCARATRSPDVVSPARGPDGGCTSSGIGGAGMSGLALVARALGATVTGSDRAAGSPYARRCARPGSSPSSATTPPTSPTAPRSSTRRAIPPDNPERAPSAQPRAAPRRPARRAHAPAADDRRHRHARQDDDVEHDRPRPAAAAAWTRATWSAARCARRARTPAGGRGSGSSSRPTSPTARCSSSPRASRCSPTPSSTTTRPTRSQRDVDETFRAFLASAEDAVVWDRPRLRALAGGPR